VLAEKGGKSRGEASFSNRGKNLPLASPRLKRDRWSIHYRVREENGGTRSGGKEALMTITNEEQSRGLHQKREMKVRCERNYSPVGGKGERDVFARECHQLP